MFEVTENDYIPLENCIFGWRWTDSNRVEISADQLGLIKPLAKEKAKAVWEYSNAFQGKAYWTRFQEIDEFHIDGRGDSERDNVTREWLKNRLPSDGEKIIISWTEQQAVVTDLETFIQYWDTFCYPVEDVVIWPSCEEWVLLFDYKQRFYYAEEKTEM